LTDVVATANAPKVDPPDEGVIYITLGSTSARVTSMHTPAHPCTQSFPERRAYRATRKVVSDPPKGSRRAGGCRRKQRYLRYVRDERVVNVHVQARFDASASCHRPVD